MIFKILAGLVGLGFVVFIHELGHFLAAKLSGITVEAFSIGWGPKLVSFRKNGTEYRLSMFPVGGYCKMKGEEVLKKALENDEPISGGGEGSFYSVSPLKRIFVSFSGPLFNILLSILVLTAVWFFGFEYSSYENRIVLASDLQPQSVPESGYPADIAGLETGDVIVSIDGEPTRNFRDIQERIVVSPEEPLEVTVRRGELERTVTVTPALDRASAGGVIGIHVWIDPVIGTVAPHSSADIAGLEAGDRITAVNGEPVEHALQLSAAFSSGPNALSVEYEREGETRTSRLVPQYAEDGTPLLGIEFQEQAFRSPELSVFGAVAKGAEETWRTFYLTLKGIGLLFRGVDLSQAVSGPIRMTYYVGEVATQGFAQGVGTGLSSVASFLSFISVALAFMNLLPFPIFDGGMIVLYFIEAVRRKPVGPRTFYRYQMVGVVIIFSLVALAFFGDIAFLLGR